MDRHTKNGGIMDNIYTLLITVALITFRSFMTKSEPEPENPPVTPLGFPIVEGWEIWYDKWAHREGSACTWPPKTLYER